MTQPQWAGEFEIDPALAARVIAEQFPSLAPVEFDVLGRGWDNLALLVNNEFVFRFPRRKLGVELLDAELRLLPAIFWLVSLPIPEPRYIGEPSDEFPFRFAGYPMIPGTTACRGNLSDAQRREMAPPLGKFLKSLHAIPADYARHHGAGPDTLRRLDIPYRTEQIHKRLEYAVSNGFCSDGKSVHAIVDEVPADYRARSDTLVHGDLYSRHLVIDNEQLAGVIDWGDVHLGDPATDLMVAWLLLPADARAAFFDAYGAVDSLARRVARFRAINHTLNVIPFAHQTGDRDLLDESLRSLGHCIAGG